MIYSFSAIYLFMGPIFCSLFMATTFRHTCVMYVDACIRYVCYRDLILLNFFSQVNNDALYCLPKGEVRLFSQKGWKAMM